MFLSRKGPKGNRMPSALCGHWIKSTPARDDNVPAGGLQTKTSAAPLYE